MLKPQEKQFKNRFNVTESNNFISKKKIANMNVILNRVRLENNKKKIKKLIFMLCLLGILSITIFFATF
jgi:hypothetical protein